MDFTGKIKDISITGREVNLTLSTYNQTILEELEKWKNKDKEISATIKKKVQKRSLDSNAYAWHLMSQIANSLETDKDSIYFKMLGRYGVFTHVIVKPSAAERLKSEWRFVKELGNVTINGSTGVQFQLYYGSSTFTQEEMNTFINGIVQEARELGIPTLEDNEIASMNKEWGL